VGSTDDVDVILHAGTDNGIITVTESGVATDLNSGYKFYDLNEPETYFLSIPSLQSTTTSTILNEGVDYEISDLSSIKFLKPLSFEDSAETFYTISGIYLSPTITNIYFQGFGESNPKAMLQNNIIYPYVSGYNSISDHHLKSKI
jgi:hypothetical protein